ncbi:hypothetical protein BDP27DRAFT_1420213 [Rhodocollybia butyracea]|uniref:Uncharacterized protein n=1 Tax=Rhodocollybia butyracea TaxID=206335 RepID=A0A9P5PUF5_9AGAR|nr:hypothetical protein BDP27DRAFT_1420213 [Rhodocollybia butyracea]
MSQDENTVEIDTEDVSSSSKKSQTVHTPSAEETKIDDFIVQLLETYKCEDDTCQAKHCFVEGNSVHVPLTMNAFRLWASAMVLVFTEKNGLALFCDVFCNVDYQQIMDSHQILSSCISGIHVHQPPEEAYKPDRFFPWPRVAHREGVDMEHPPAGPKFSSQANNNDINDIALLACRRVGLLPQQQQPHITVNLAGLPDLLQRQPLQNLATNANTAQQPPPRPR